MDVKSYLHAEVYSTDVGSTHPITTALLTIQRLHALYADGQYNASHYIQRLVQLHASAAGFAASGGREQPASRIRQKLCRRDVCKRNTEL